MKKVLFLSSLFVLLTFVLQAQISKGSVFLGGSIGFSTYKAKDTSLKSNSVSVSPVIGIAIKRDLIVGINVNYWHSKNNLNDFNNQTENESYGGGIFMRKYVPLGKGFYLFGETGLNYLSQTYTSTTSSQKSESKVQYVNINLYPGVSYAVSKNLQLEFGLPQLVTLGYSKTRTAENDVTTQNMNGVGFNASASSFSDFALGFRIILPK